MKVYEYNVNRFGSNVKIIVIAGSNSQALEIAEKEVTKHNSTITELVKITEVKCGVIYSEMKDYL